MGVPTDLPEKSDHFSLPTGGPNWPSWEIDHFLLSMGAPTDLHEKWLFFVTHGPSPLKCFSAPRHQILAKKAPQNARNHDKAEFATKVLNQINLT